MFNALRRSLWRWARGRCVCRCLPLGGACGELNEVVLARHSIPLCNPAFGERRRCIGRAFLAWSIYHQQLDISFARGVDDAYVAGPVMMKFFVDYARQFVFRARVLI